MIYHIARIHDVYSCELKAAVRRIDETCATFVIRLTGEWLKAWPIVDRAPLMHMMEERRREKERWHQIQAVESWAAMRL